MYEQGQGPNQERLVETCKNSAVDIVNLAFVNVFPDQGPGDWPGTNFGNACDGNTYTHNNVSTDLLSGCTYIGEDIETCQSTYGKTILLSIGGAYPANGYIESNETAIEFADFLWGAFGPYGDEVNGTTAWQAAGGPRPFGKAAVDGFDFDIETNDISPVPTSSDGTELTDYKSRGYATMIQQFKESLFPMDLSKNYYISGAPQCPLPDVHLSSVISESWFDFIFVQFYNTAGCSARDGVDALNSTVSKRDNSEFNFEDWSQISSLNPDFKVYLGLPASEGAVTDADYYLTPEEVEELVDTIYDNDAFGGIMLWEATYSMENVINGSDYATHMKAILEDEATGNATSTSSVSSTASATATSSSVASTSTASVTSTSSSVASTSATSSSTSSSVTVSSASASSTTASSSAVSTSSVAASGTGASASSAASVSETSAPASFSSMPIYSNSSSTAVSSSSSSVAPVSASASISGTGASSSAIISASATVNATSAAPSSTASACSAGAYVSNGKTFQLECDTNAVGTVLNTTSSLRKRDTQATFDLCIAECASTTGCVAVTYETEISECTLYSAVESTFTDAGVEYAVIVGSAAASATITSAASLSSTASQTTVTEYSTTVITEISCAATVTDCPASSTNLITSSVPVATNTYAVGPITEYSTTLITITSCAATVTDCPASSTVVMTSSVPHVTVGPVTTSTVYTTTLETITSCAATVTDCPAESQMTTVVTKTVDLYTTVCPVTAAQSSAAAVQTSAAAVQSSAPAQATPVTKTIYSTDLITVTKCAASVTNCPAESQTTTVSTTVYAVATTVVTETPSAAASSAASTTVVASSATEILVAEETDTTVVTSQYTTYTSVTTQYATVMVTKTLQYANDVAVAATSTLTSTVTSTSTAETTQLVTMTIVPVQVEAAVATGSAEASTFTIVPIAYTAGTGTASAGIVAQSTNGTVVAAVSATASPSPMAFTGAASSVKAGMGAVALVMGLVFLL